jgi:hypothetical protein
MRKLPRISQPRVSLRRRSPIAAVLAATVLFGAVAPMGLATAAFAAEAKPPVSLAELAVLVEACTSSSRPILLGSRNPQESSCVRVISDADVKAVMPGELGDVNGGPGTTMAMLYDIDRQNCQSAWQDFAWHQGRLRIYLENEAIVNRPAAEEARKLAEKARQFLETVEAWTSCPAGLFPVGYRPRGDWLGYCVAELDKAVAARNLPAIKRWAGELAAATFSLADLHRWLGFLVENHLAALEFQQRCRSLFAAPDGGNVKYDRQVTISCFPAGILCSNGRGNYYEIERQAERLFSMPPDRVVALFSNEKPTPGSLWMLPGVRNPFETIENVLSPANRRTLEEAARSPYHHSYLKNMLYRAASTNTVDDVCAVLKKFDAIYPRATIAELMDVLMYKGHSFGGIGWDDRYQPELRRAAEKLLASASDAEAMVHAWRWTHAFYVYRGPDGYGQTITLREALDVGKLDCVRATDMIGAIYRNAGRACFGNVRWSAGTAGHSAAAYLGAENGKCKTLVVDGLMSSASAEAWPECYYRGHAWPSGLESNPAPYAVELYVRGIDSYIWAEGYIIRGPNAGQLTTAGIPYLPLRQSAGTRKVFSGPYPE